MVKLEFFLNLTQVIKESISAAKLYFLIRNVRQTNISSVVECCITYAEEAGEIYY